MHNDQTTGAIGWEVSKSVDRVMHKFAGQSQSTAVRLRMTFEFNWSVYKTVQALEYIPEDLPALQDFISEVEARD